MLAHSELFSGIPMEALTALAEEGRLRRFAAGGRLWQRGAIARSLHVILRGRVRLERRHRELATPLGTVECGPGEVAGAYGVLDGIHRIDDAVAAEETETLELDAPALALLMVQHPRETLALRRALLVSTTDATTGPTRRRKPAGATHRAGGPPRRATGSG